MTRSPTSFAGPSRRAAYAVVRWKNVLLTTLVYQVARRFPKFMKSAVRKGVVRRLPPGYDVDTHFKPLYEPWDQRLCLVPDGDLFEAIRGDRVAVVTDAIDTFTERGVLLASGRELAADVIVTATGLNLLLLGGLKIAVDGEEVDASARVAYKGMMLSGVPNLAFTIGYTNASWTLKGDLVAGYVCRLLLYMDRCGYAVCTPKAPDASLPTRPLLDLTSG